jgi:hypothetical protein
MAAAYLMLLIEIPNRSPIAEASRQVMAAVRRRSTGILLFHI